MDFRSTSGGCEEDGDEAKWMGETYDTMELALYVKDFLV